MASKSSRQTFAKHERERALKERRALKQEKKEEKRRAAAAERAAEAPEGNPAPATDSPS
jgi:hypothetical protein